MNRLRTLGLVGLLLATPQVTGAQAVSSSDFQTLMSRLERLERRLSTMEGAGGGTAAAGGSTADLELRMQDLEHEGSELNGGMERLGNAVERLAKRVDDITKDFDLRLQDLEKSGGGTATAAPAVVAETEKAAAPAAETAETEEAKPAAETKATETAAPASAVPADLSPKDLYDKAYSYLTATDYATSKVWFAEFIKRFPKDKLADNGHYWLGEIALVQNNPQEALVNFKNGLTAFPKGAKAPANLYKMGIAMQALEQVDFAKGAWSKLVKDFPKSPEAAKAKEKLKDLAAKKK